METEPDLSEVFVDDKPLIRNIIYTAMALNKSDPFCSGWQVQCLARGYVVLFFLLPGYAVSVHDLMSLRELNSARITNVIVSACPAPGGGGGSAPAADVALNKDREPQPRYKAVLKVQVLDCKQHVMLYDTDVVRVRKRARESLR